MGGWNRLSPDAAYRFARGEEVQAFNGMAVRLRRPLDFLVVADHAEGLGLAAALQSDDPTFPSSEVGKKFREAYEQYTQTPESRSPTFYGKASGAIRSLFWSESIDLPYRQTIWQRVVANADNHNDPGRFTAFVGYEWSSLGTRNATEFGNLHRVVVFREGGPTAAKTFAFSQVDSQRPEDLWRHLADYEAATGGRVIAIPHNSNVSNGEMFATRKLGGEQLDISWAALRSRFETIMEVTQFKGDSETHPALSPRDEFADFETWNNWAGRPPPGFTPANPEDFVARKRGEYARSALKTGLRLEQALGINPFKFGVIGSTDTHTSLATADSDNFWGKFSLQYPQAVLRNWELSAAGYAAVWAHENTREAIFAAMNRREVYATTGPRMTVRFFGGWDFVEDDAHRPDLAKIGYTRGVPMGGDLAGAKSAPTFLIAATKDPDGANLDRVQIVKGWLDATGELHERVYNVAVSDDRGIRSDGSVEPLGSTVDVAAASYVNSIGDAELRSTWRDTEFDPSQSAFYYVRVLEIPTPRWTAYDAHFFAIKEIATHVPMVIQERAYTSPIWYTPDGASR